MTKSFVLIVEDPDAEDKPWVHWLLFNIAPEITQLEAGIKTGNFVSGATDFYYTQNNIFQYGGPYPPQGTHRYFFKLSALDIILPLNASASKDDVIKAMEGHILAATELIGLYSRK